MRILSFQFISKAKAILIKKSILKKYLKLVPLFVSHSKECKLSFFKCADILSLFLSVSTFFIHHIHSYTKILTRTPRIPTPISCIPIRIPHIPIISTLIASIPIIPFIPFPNSPFQLLQIAYSSVR